MRKSDHPIGTDDEAQQMMNEDYKVNVWEILDGILSLWNWKEYRYTFHWYWTEPIIPD